MMDQTNHESDPSYDLMIYGHIGSLPAACSLMQPLHQPQTHPVPVLFSASIACSVMTQAPNSQFIQVQ